MANGIGYVNQGPDPRLGGPVGAVLARTQTALSWHSPDPPKSSVVSVGKTEIMVAWPPFLSINTEKDNGRFASFRIGWRYDKNWAKPGDAEGEPTGGFIGDVIIKLDMDHRVHY